MFIDNEEEGKFLTKLVEVGANGVGAVAGSWIKRRDARANADAARIEAQGQRDALDISEGRKRLGPGNRVIDVTPTIDVPAITPAEQFYLETDARITFQERKRQTNIQDIFSRASQQAGPTSEEPVDPDWIARFFTYAQDISSENLQKIWASLLANEVKAPGSCSLRTLEALKSLSKHEAALFEKVRTILWEDFIPSTESNLALAGLGIGDLMALEEAGLVDAGFGRARTVVNLDNSGAFGGVIRLSKESALVILHAQPDAKMQLGAYSATAVGRELNKILPSATLNQPFMLKTIEPFKSQGFTFGISNKVTDKGVGIENLTPL